MTIVASFAAALLLSIQTQTDSAALLARLETLSGPAAAKVMASDTAAAGGALESLIARVDASVHSDRQRPEQRRVEYDKNGLALGLRLSSTYAKATGDRTYLRRFEARKQRLDGTQLLNDRRYREAMRPLNAALAESQALNDKWLQAITRVNLAYGHLELGQGQQALRESEQAVEIASTLDNRARALTLYNLASVHLHIKDFTRGVESARQAVAASRTAGNKLWEGNSLINLGVVHQQLGELEASQQAFESALAVLETTKDRIGTGRVLYNLGLIALNQARYPQAADYLERALPIIRSADIRHSHEIELDPEKYQNPIEVAAVQALIEIYSETGDTARAETHKAALRKLQSRPAPAHSHKQP